MASGSKCLKSCSQKNEDRISGLPDALLCHILSCFSTREAVRTSVLSHRWKNVWADVRNLYLDENEFGDDTDKFERFVNGVLLHRSPVDIKRFCLVTSMMRDVPLLYTWFSIAIRRNVVELDLTIGRDYATDKRPFFELPNRFLRCSTLVRLTLWLRTNIDVQPTKSNRFPCLKFLHVTVVYPDSDSMKNLFTHFPVLEDLIIDGTLEDTAAFKLKISAPKLKRLQNKLDVAQLALIFPMFAPRNFKNYKCKIFMNVDAPNLEELDMCSDVLLSFSLRNAKRLCKVKIDFLNVEQLMKNHDRYLGLADRIRQTFAGICDAKYLTVGAPISAVLGIGYQRLLPTFNSLNHLELLLQSCRDLQSLATLLKMSPNLEHLKISVTKPEYPKDSKYCDEDNGDVVLHEWDAPEFAHISLISHLKTVCLWDFKGCPNDMEVMNYLVKNGKSLNKVTIHTRSSENKDMESQSPTALTSQFSKFPWGSKTCEIEYRTIV